MSSPKVLSFKTPSGPESMSNPAVASEPKIFDFSFGRQLPPFSLIHLEPCAP
jgi:hypothetical protein